MAALIRLATYHAKPAQGEYPVLDVDHHLVVIGVHVVPRCTEEARNSSLKDVYFVGRR
ncbi:MAG: hypothetical protein QOE33_3823 [Acidobacteriota bacterium]|nr:hypothetical protein [Acidobacteriota bacterium]